MRLEPQQLNVLRAMTPGQRLCAAEELYDFARAFKSAVLRKDHPDWTADQVRRAVNEWFLHGRT